MPSRKHGAVSGASVRIAGVVPRRRLASRHSEVMFDPRNDSDPIVGVCGVRGTLDDAIAGEVYFDGSAWRGGAICWRKRDILQSVRCFRVDGRHLRLQS
jgi:hypothetical protein